MRYEAQRTHSLAAATTRALGICTLLLMGCGAPVAQLSAEIPRQAVPAAVQAGIGSLDDPETRRRIERILASPEMQAIQRDLVAGIVDATLTTFDDQGRSQKIGLVADRAVAGTFAVLDRELPAFGQHVTRGAIDGALDAMLSPSRGAAVAKQVGLVLDAGLTSAANAAERAEIAKAMSVAMKDEIGPAMRAALRDQVAPGLAETLKNEELQRALGLTARTLGRELVLGVTEALAQQKPPPESDSLLGRLSGLAQKGASLFGSAAWVLVLVIAALFVWILKLLAQARRYRADADRRAEGARLLEDTARSFSGKPWGSEVMSALEQRIREERRAAEEQRQQRRRGPPRERHA